MAEPKTLQPGDPCPNCGGAFVVDASQAPETLIEHHKRVAASPHAHARYAEAVKDKADRDGILHVCEHGDYHARFKTNGKKSRPFARGGPRPDDGE